MNDPSAIALKLRAIGAHMARTKYQRPEIKASQSADGEKFWRGEWRVYIEGRAKPKHRAQSWAAKRYTKSQAQKELDALVKAETEGPRHDDGSMTVSEFWTRAYWPTTKLHVASNTRKSYEWAWRKYISGKIGASELQHVNKAAIDAILNGMAKDGMGKGTISVVLSVVSALFSEAQENGYIIRNPARKVTTPNAAPPKVTRPLSEDEARRLFALPDGAGPLKFRLMLVTGARIGEILALAKNDIFPAGIRIDESAGEGHKPSTTKSKKTRFAPLPPAVRAELLEYARTITGELLFPDALGRLDSRNSMGMRRELGQIRQGARIADLTARMCRTTFATLFAGDPRDVQDILGHASVDLTMNVYRRPITERQQASVDDLEARFSGRVVTMPERKKESA